MTSIAASEPRETTPLLQHSLPRGPTATRRPPSLRRLSVTRRTGRRVDVSVRTVAQQALPEVCAEDLPSPVASVYEAEDPDRPKGFDFAIIYGCILLGDFFVGYDTSCVTTLTPVIGDEFNAINDVGWYGIAYILALASSVLTFGQLYSIFPMKAIFLSCFWLFTVGSVICAAAPTSLAFIIGRAISGLGSAGIFSGGTIIIAHTTSLKRRPIYQAVSSGMECTALALGPLINGAISYWLSWRMCFYIMVPVALAIILVVHAFVSPLPNTQPKEYVGMSLRDRLCQLDLLGISLFIPATISLILALQWGGSVYPWRSAPIIGLFLAAVLLGAAFVWSQKHAGQQAMFPLGLLRQRSVSLGSAGMFFVSAAAYVFDFYMPIYFQAIRGSDTLESGLWYLPTAISFAVAILVAGQVTSWIGYYIPVLVVGIMLMCLGSALMTLWDAGTSGGTLVWHQLLFGLGSGLAFQQPYIAIQTVLPQRNVATAIVVLSFTQELGGIVALAVSQTVFLNQFLAKLKTVLPNLDARSLLDAGPLSLADQVPERYRKAVFAVYNASLIDVFWIGVVCSCFTMLALGIEWRSVKEDRPRKELDEDDSGSDH